MSYAKPTVADFKAYFVRDFPYQPAAPEPVDIGKYIQDADIQRAIDEVCCQINQGLFCDEDQYKVGFMLYTAHIMIMNIQASSQGLNASFTWNETSKSVGSISVSQQIPESMLKDPYYAWLSKTPYGVRYLMMILPRLVGSIFFVRGATQP